MVEPFKPGNRFSDVVSIAASAVEWQGLNVTQQELVVVENGLPYLAGVPDLTQRAEAILDAAERRIIKGFTHTEDGEPLSAENIKLYRDSLDAWIAKARKRLPPDMSSATAVPAVVEVDALLRVEDVVDRLGISRTTFYRWQHNGRIEKAHAENPPRWRSSYVASLIASTTDGDSDDI